MRSIFIFHDVKVVGNVPQRHDMSEERDLSCVLPTGFKVRYKDTWYKLTSAYSVFEKNVITYDFNLSSESEEV